MNTKAQAKPSGIPSVEKSDKVTRYAVAEAIIGQREQELVAEAVATGWVSSAGPFVEKFEQAFAEYCGSPYAVSVCNGTTALHLALEALGVGAGDEVIVPAITFVATAAAVVQCNATPVIADVDPAHWNITRATIEPVMTPRVKAIIPVHLFGQPAPIDEIREAFPAVLMIEDAAEAHGAKLGSRVAGAIGDAGTYSFYGNKLMTTGEGGMVLTRDRNIYERCRKLRNHGASSKRYWHDELGYNYRMTNIQAALGLAQLERLDEVIAHRQRLRRWYENYLSDIPGIIFQARVENTFPVYWMIAVRYDFWDSYEARDAVVAKLAESGIETRPMFYPLHELPACKDLPKAKDLKNSNQIARSGIVLPSGSTLSEDDVAYICSRFREALSNN